MLLTLYCQDGWFQLDFTIVIFSWVALIDGVPNLKPFRAFRGLRALKAVCSTALPLLVSWYQWQVKFLTYCAAVMDALSEAIPQFGDVLSVTVFLMIIFGIMGIQSLKCKFQYQCAIVEDGETELMLPETWCNDAFPCPSGFTCEHVGNPSDGNISFDNLGMALFTMFQVLTLEGWTGTMYMAMDAEGGYMAFYFIFCVFLFAFIAVNLFVAVITTTFQRIRRQRDREEQEALAAAGLMISESGAIVKMENPLSEASTADPAERGKNELEDVLKGVGMEHYLPNIMNMVDDLAELKQLTESDMVEGGIKLLHARRIITEARKITPVAELLALVQVDSTVPAGSLDQESKILQFLRQVELQKYYPEIVAMCDNMDDVSKMTYDDCLAAGMKVVHARTMVAHVETYRLRHVDPNDPVANSPVLLAMVGGETAGMFNNRLIDTGNCLPASFWKTCLGQSLIKMWYRADPMIDYNDPPRGEPRTKFLEAYPRFDGRFGHLVAADEFDLFISAAIVLNIVFMALEHEGMSPLFLLVLDVAEVVFTLIFVGEMMCKFMGLGGLKWYFENPYNILDFFLVVTSIPSVFEILFGTESAFNLSPIRACRLFRLFRLIEAMRQLIDVIMSSAKAISNLLVFILFALFIFAILGLQLFAGQVFDEDGELPRSNFDTFPVAVLTLFQVMTGEDWNAVMYNVMLRQKIMGVLYFCSFFIFANFILMEMFTAVILENFMLQHDEKLALQRELYEAQLEKEKTANLAAEEINKELVAEIAARKKKEEEEWAKRNEARIKAEREGRKLEVSDKSPEAVAKREELQKKEMEELKLQIQEQREQAQGKSNTAPVVDDLGPIVVEKSCWMFTKENTVREACLNISSHWAFEYFIFLCIIGSSACLAVQKSYKPDRDLDAILAYVDLGFLVAFTSEAVIKIIALGFSGAQTAYINDIWNKLDFFVVVMSIFFAIFRDLPGSVARMLRIFRCIRPLRMINQNERIRFIFDALFLGAPEILNVMFLLLFLIFLFAVLGVGLYMGTFKFCNMDATGEVDCLGITANDDDIMVPAVWGNPHYHFDNVLAAMMCLFEVSSLEGWLDVMYSCMDATGVGLQPVQDNNPLACLYICAFICLGPFFVLNIVVGVIIEKFNQVSGRGILTDEQKQYKDTLMSVVTSDSSPIMKRPGKTSIGIRQWCYDVVTSPSFENAVMLLICANSVLMALEHCGQSDGFTNMLDLLNTIFVAVFSVELCMRLLAIDLGIFFRDPWNVMDFVIVVGCLAMIPLDGAVNVQALRPFRLFLIFRMIKRAKGIKLMVSALLCSLPAMFNVASLLFLTFFVFSILGMQIFGNVKYGEFLNKDANFRDFGSSMLLLMRVVTGESWNFIMFDCQIEYPHCTNYNGPATDGIGDESETDPSTVSGFYLMNDCGSSFFAGVYFVTFYILCNYAVRSF